MGEREYAVTAGGIPLGVSEEYDALPEEGDEMTLRCQDCDRAFADRLRRSSDGCGVLACFCSDCRLARRTRLASPLPRAWARSLPRNER